MKKLLTLTFLLSALAGCASYTPEEALLQDINQAVNAQMTWVGEASDSWNTRCPAKGDCEDFALCKARKLTEAGVAAPRISLLVGSMPSGVGHMVTVVDNNYVLDSLTPWIYSESEREPLEKRAYSCTLKGELIYWGIDAGGTGWQPVMVKPASSLDKCKRALEELGVYGTTNR